MFKDDSINLTYKRLQLLETNDKSMQEGGRVKCKRFTIVIKRKCRENFRIRFPLGDTGSDHKDTKQSAVQSPCSL